MAGCVLAAAIVAATASAPAQPEHPMGRPMERMERLKKVRMIEMLSLSEDQSSRFFARLNEHENRRRELMKAKGESLDKVERLVRNRADEKEIEKVFAEVADAEGRFAEENQRFFAGLKDLLTVEQRAKFLLFERQFERELREALRDVSRRRFRANEE
jgi:Spy/CpxP family protein refolding chaperone